MQNNLLILAVDTSCDDTSAAMLHGNTILSNIIASQTELHKPYGGVFPTVAKQAHKENIDLVVKTALKRANKALGQKTALTINSIDALAVTVGPGLAPALEVGLNYMKKLAVENDKPLISVNHIEGHVLSVLAKRNSRSKKIGMDYKNNGSEEKINYPVLSIIVSGGHTQFILITEIGKYEIIGTSIDDAAGECLDKIGRMLNLGYPAGPTIEKFAKLGDPKAVTFPLPMTTTKTFDMSFSGLKTFARNYIEDTYGKSSLNKKQIYDLCASTQYGVFRHIMYKLSKVLEKYQIGEVWLGGGVAANIKLRQMIRKTIGEFEKTVSIKNQNDQTKPTKKIVFRVPHTNKLCMDNAAMIGVVARFKFERGKILENKNLEKLNRMPKWKITNIKKF
jgi:N6-L-threonylcarbamoyladenine synthase